MGSCSGTRRWTITTSRTRHSNATSARSSPKRPTSGHEDRLVFLADGLARPGLPHRAQRDCFVDPDAGGSCANCLTQLRPDRLALVRLRTGASRSTTRRALTDRQEAAAGDHHRQPSRPRAPATPTARSSRPNADYYTPEQSVGGYRRPAPVGILHDDLAQRPMGVGRAEGRREAVRSLPGDVDPLRRRRRQPVAERGPDAQRRDRARAGRAGSRRWAHGWPNTARASTARAAARSSRAATASRPARARPSYLHICAWPEDSLKLPPIPAKVVRSRVLTGGKLKCVRPRPAWKSPCGQSDRQPMDTIIALELDRPALGLAAVDVPVEPVADHERQGHRIKRLSKPSRVRPGQGGGRPRTIPAGPPTPTPRQPGWRLTWASRRGSAARPSSRPFRS